MFFGIIIERFGLIFGHRHVIEVDCLHRHEQARGLESTDFNSIFIDVNYFTLVKFGLYMATDLRFATKLDQSGGLVLVNHLFLEMGVHH